MPLQPPTLHGPSQLLHEWVTASYPRCSRGLGLPLKSAAASHNPGVPPVQQSAGEWPCPWPGSWRLRLTQNKTKGTSISHYFAQGGFKLSKFTAAIRK